MYVVFVDDENRLMKWVCYEKYGLLVEELWNGEGI